MTREVLDRIAAALAPLGPRVVIAGGAAQASFALHPLGRSLPFEPLITEDVDVARFCPTDHPKTPDIGLHSTANPQGRLDRLPLKVQESRTPCSHCGCMSGVSVGL